MVNTELNIDTYSYPYAGRIGHMKTQDKFTNQTLTKHSYITDSIHNR